MAEVQYFFDPARISPDSTYSLLTARTRQAAFADTWLKRSSATLTNWRTGRHPVPADQRHWFAYLLTCPAREAARAFAADPDCPAGKGIEAEIRRILCGNVLKAKDWPAKLKQLKLVYTSYPIEQYYRVEVTKVAADLASVPSAAQPPRIEPMIGRPRLPHPASQLLIGRDSCIDLLDRAWEGWAITEQVEDPQPIHVVQFVGDGGMGKSALVWHWLERVRLKKARVPAHIFEWSFFSQGQNEYVYDSQAFLDAAKQHFERLCSQAPPGKDLELLKRDEETQPRLPADRLGEAVAEAFSAFDGIMVLDGVEPLQHPPDYYNGRLSDKGLIAFVSRLRQDLARETGKAWLLVITTRYTIPDFAGSPGVRTINLEKLSPAQGAELLREYRLHGSTQSLWHRPLSPVPNLTAAVENELRLVAVEYVGHPLSLSLLASYLLACWDGDIARRDRVTESSPITQVGPYWHADRVMRSYDRIFQSGGSPLAAKCRQVLCLIGLFTKPVAVSLVDELRRRPSIAGLTDGLTDEWYNAAVNELRRLGLLNPEADPEFSVLDAHPLIREHFGNKTLRVKNQAAWRQAHQCLFEHFAGLAQIAEHPSEKLDYLLQAIVHGCKAGLYREALHEIYLSQVMRGDEFYAFTRLGAVGPLLTAITHFFQPGHWDRPIEAIDVTHALSQSDELTILTHAGLFLMTSRGYADRDVESVCRAALGRCESQNTITPELFSALSRTRVYYLIRAELASAWKFSVRLLQLSAMTMDSRDLLVANHAAGLTKLMQRDLPAATKYLTTALEHYDPAQHRTLAFLHIHDLGVATYCFLGRAMWYLGDDAAALDFNTKALALAAQLELPYSIVFAQLYLGWIHLDHGNNTEARRYLELARDAAHKHRYGYWHTLATILRSQAIVSQADLAEEAKQDVKYGIESYRASGSVIALPYLLGVAATVHEQAGDLDTALRYADEALAIARNPRREQRLDEAELLRIRGGILARTAKHSEKPLENLRESLALARSEGTPGIERRVLETGRRLGYSLG